MPQLIFAAVMFYVRSSNRHQGTNVEATVVQKLNQCECTVVLYYPPCLNFLVLFLSREKVQRKDQGKESKEQCLFLF
jgi:hypothetical protein